MEKNWIWFLLFLSLCLAGLTVWFYLNRNKFNQDWVYALISTCVTFLVGSVWFLHSKRNNLEEYETPSVQHSEIDKDEDFPEINLEDE